MNKWSFLGSITFLLGAIGHFLIVDLSVWILQADYVHWLPHSLLSEMKSTIVDWGMMGKNNFSNIFSGFSLWMVFSLSFIAIFNFLIFRQLPYGHKLRMQSLILCLIIAIIFLTVSIVCFIYPPMIGGFLALLFFGLAIKKEIENKK